MKRLNRHWKSERLEKIRRGLGVSSIRSNIGGFKMRTTSLVCSAIFLVLLVVSPISLFCQQNPDQGQKDLPAKVIKRPRAVQKEVSFQTDDAWRIFGTYTVPASYKEGEKLPAVLLLASAPHSQVVWGVYPGWSRIQDSIPTLRIDLRGRGKSEGSVPFEDFTPAQREGVALDVRAGFNFLSAQPEVDQRRLGVVAEGFSAGPAIIGAFFDPRARAFVLVSGLLDQKALDVLSSNVNKPLLFIVSNEDKPSFSDLTKAYTLTKNVESDIWVQDGLGSGLSMGSVWRSKYPSQPEERAIDFLAGEWLMSKLRRFGQIKEIKLQTADGWTLYANLGLPENIKKGQLVPGVILLPTALSDRSSFHNLEQLLVINGIAVLNIDWRGIGKSIDKGNLLDLPGDVFAQALNDLHEGYRFLSSLDGIDRQRIGILGGAVGAKLAIAGSKDLNVRTLALLSPITRPNELASDRQRIAAINCPILLVTSDGLGESTRELAQFVARNQRNAVRSYPGGLLGYALFNSDERLEQTITDWFKLQLQDSQ
jgi:dienelactone hydrolase